MDAKRFWVFDWLDENEITSSEQIETIVSDKRQFKVFQDAARAIGGASPTPTQSENAILAGRGVDLTGIGSCNRHRECIKLQVDVLIRRCWYYFDEVVVDDLTRYIAGISFRNLRKESIAGWLEAILYLKDLGAEELVRFVCKSFYCLQCRRDHAINNFHNDFDTSQTELVSIFERTLTLSKTEARTSRAYVDCRLEGPILDGSFGSAIAVTKIKNMSDAELKRNLVQDLLRNGFRQLSDDSITASICNAALGSATKLERFLLQYVGSVEGDLTNTIAFNLNLPYLKNATVSDLVKMREQGNELEAFRTSIRLAIHERIKTSTDNDATSIAREIKQDLIDPKLSQLKLSLAKNAETLSKTSLGATIGYFAGIVGLMTPSLSQFGASSLAAGAALTAAAAAAYKERNSLKSSELYFLLDPISDH